VTLRPRSFFGRTVLLVGLLLFLSHAAAVLLYFFSFAGPAADRAARILADQWHCVQGALKALPAERRAGYLDELRAVGIGVRSRIDPRHVRKRPLFLQRMIMADLGRRLGPGVPIVLSNERPSRVWLPVDAGPRKLWVGFVQRPLDRPFPRNALFQLSLMLTLAAVGAWIVVRRIVRPLDNLARTAAQIGRGEIPKPLSNEEPDEILVVHRAFDRMARDVRQAVEDRALLLAGVSHDLRTPLARLRLALEISDNRIDPGLNTGMVQDVEEIDRIIGQFLLYVREGVDEPFESGDLNVLVRRLAERYTQQGQPLQLDLSDLPTLPLKPLAMRRAITNLVENALRHGGGTALIRTISSHDRVVLEVLDRGPGVKASEVERLRRPFSPLDDRGDVGLHGIGLAIVDRIARLHGGTLSLSPREGGGLRASVVLPRRSGEAPDQP
jgi:two-component system osmolarity sensor histidine kinase EnvZ